MRSAYREEAGGGGKKFNVELRAASPHVNNNNIYLPPFSAMDSGKAGSTAMDTTAVGETGGGLAAQKGGSGGAAAMGSGGAGVGGMGATSGAGAAGGDFAGGSGGFVETKEPAAYTSFSVSDQVRWACSCSS